MLSLLLIIVEEPVHAQEAPEETEDVVAEQQPLEEAAEKSTLPFERISVTARLYEEYLQLVPASVDVMTADYLTKQGLVNVRDIIDFAPGGATTAFNKFQDNYSLRGISSQTEGSSGDSSVPIVIDDVVISREFMKSQDFFDMQVVEILRGPQGTSFGRNASSGLIHLKTARPQWRFGSGVTAEFGNYDSYDLEAFTTGALSKTTAGRFAVNFDKHGGFTEDTRTGESLGGTQNFALRGSLLSRPSSAVRVYTKVEYSRDDDDNPSPRKGQDCTIDYQGSFPETSVAGAPQPGWTLFPDWSDSCDPWETTISERTYLGDFFLEREIFNITSRVIWTISDAVNLTSISAYLRGTSDYLIDTHGGPNNSMFQSTQNDAWQLSQELRLDNYHTLNRLRWLAGFFYLRDDQARDDQNIFYVENAASDPQHPSGFRPETRDIKQQNNETTALGLFGELSFSIKERLNLTIGGRWSFDEKDYSVAHYGWGWGGPIAGLTNGVDADGDGVLDEQCIFDPSGPPDFGQRFCGSPENPVGFETPVPSQESWDNVSLKLSLDYILDHNRMIYGLISEGYKTGGFQTEPFNPFDAAVPFNEETVINYEIGYRSTFAERFRLNAFVFVTEYEDLQLFLFVNSDTGDFNQITANAADADILGFEIDYAWLITDNLRLNGTYARIDAELTNALIDTDGDSVKEDFGGTRPSNSPKWTSTAILEYDYPLKSGDSLTLRGDWRGISNLFDGIGEDPNREHEGYSVFGARAVWRPAGKSWGLAVWGRNLLDEVYTINVGPYQPNVNQLNFAYGAPRAFGITIYRHLS